MKILFIRKNNKGFVGLLALLIVLVIIVIVSYKFMIQPGDNPVGINEAKRQIDKAKEIANLAEERAKQLEGQLTEAGDLLRGSKIEATLKISTEEDKKDYFAMIEEGTSAIDFMKKINEDKNDFSFEYKDSSMGAFVDEINGIGNNAKTNMYWMFYVNDELAKTGASEYTIVNGDIIEWRYEDVSNAFK